ncbi:MAG: S1 RNA-binding domain-containing protein [Candidatus Aenigmarchaeota archaeon]|nr:S1 RNA-binding domain-containing protein [Candidatus Aenigmarchaeota archaeon]
MAKKRGFPMQGELVICIVRHVNPNSAELILEEYDKEGMIHISEIVSGWVNSIKDHLKAGQKVVAKVTKVNEDDGYIALSIKRVEPRQEKEKLKEYNLDKKAEKLLEMAAKLKKKTLSAAYEEVGFAMQEHFGSLFKAFKKAMGSPTALTDKGIPEGWASVIQEIAEKNIEQKEFEFRANATMTTHEPDGIDAIKALLGEAEKMGIGVHYISAPFYMFKYRTKDAKKGEKYFTDAIEKIKARARPKIECKAEIV